MQQLNTQLQSISAHISNELKALTSHVNMMPSTIDYDAMDDRVTTIEDKISNHKPKFMQVLQFVQRLGGANTTPRVENELDLLKAQVIGLQQELKSINDISSLSTTSKSIGEQMRDVKHQLKILQQRITGNGVQIGTKVFQSFEDVKTWVTTNIPTRRYGLSLDAVSLLDFISASNHSDSEKTFMAFHNQQKTGFTSMHEPRVAISTQHLFPTVFGRSQSTGLDNCEFLPALPDVSKWDAGSTGLRYHINKSLIDVVTQVESAIDSILDSHNEAQHIAMECLIESKRFISELCHFIFHDYIKWLHRGHSKREAWKITAICRHRIFDALHSERITARDILDQSNVGNVESTLRHGQLSQV